MGLALSTSWNAYRHKNADKILSEIEKIGFKEIELSFNLTDSMVRQIQRRIKDTGLKVTSIHNYCPIPYGLPRKIALPDCYSMASLDEKERSLAIKYTKNTIETAALIGSKAVVLHCGRIEVPDRTRALISLYKKEGKSSFKYRRLKLEFQGERNRLVKPFLEQSLKSLKEINNHAKRFNVRLGIENRFYIREIPSFKEIGIILNIFNNSNIFYWHDTGHARVIEKLGLVPNNAFIRTYYKKMIGIHLHDIENFSDHLAPLQGSFNFSALKPFIKKDTILVIEAHSPASPGDILKSRQFLNNLFNDDTN